jgi:hypothetical protein
MSIVRIYKNWITPLCWEGLWERSSENAVEEKDIAAIPKEIWNN